ncbi:Lysine--tRNA ligase [Trichinella pseudospiralis]|uniref:Uncharacterized protein n=1 Tax=Trichinella pseudospiralis TaxID=6337 RepID=A0A0V0YK50_TRIPS|nr:hypothetical protein T4E_4560 [Trichinella pseudospiralis]
MIWIVKNIVLFLLFYSSSFAYGDKNSTVPQRFYYNGESLSESAVNILTFDLVTMDLTSESYFNGIDILQSYHFNYCLKLNYFGKWLEKYSDATISSKEYKSVRDEILESYKAFLVKYTFSIVNLDRCEKVTKAFLDVLKQIGNLYNFVR